MVDTCGLLLVVLVTGAQIQDRDAARPKLAGQIGFQVLPRRWVAERTFAWINRCRRTVRDYERLPEHHAAMVHSSMVIIMTRRLARHRRTTHQQPPTRAA